MLYNTELKKIRTRVDCQSCKYFQKQTKECKGLGKCCFECDEKTKTAFDPVTKMPIKFN